MKYFISACLVGDICRWHGRKANIPPLIQQIISTPGSIIIKACPEILAGLGTPRPPVKMIKGRIFETHPDKAKRPFVTGRELTDKFLYGAKEVLKIIKETKPDKIILCDFSPSCARNGVLGKLLTQNNIPFTNIF